MKVEGISRSDLDKALKIVKSLMYFPGADTSIVLSSVKKTKSLTLSADTANHRVRASVAVEKVLEEGDTMVEVAHLYGLHLTGKSVTMETVGENLIIKSGRGKYKLITVEGEPKVVPMPEADTSVVVEVGLLQKGLSCIWFGQDDTGSGDVRLSFGRGKLIIETSDKYCGASFSRAIPSLKKIVPPRRVVLSKKTVDTVLSAFDKEESISVKVSESTATFMNDVSFIELPLVTDTKLPDVTGMIKSRTDRSRLGGTITLNAGRLVEVAASAASVVEEAAKFKSVQTFLTIKKGKKGPVLMVEAEGDIGSYSSSVVATGASKSDKAIRFSVLSRHLSNLILPASRASDSITLEVWGKKSNGMVAIKSTDSNNKVVYLFPQAGM